MPSKWGERVLRAKEGGTEWTLENLHADGVPLSQTLAEMKDKRVYEPMTRYDAIEQSLGKEHAERDAQGLPPPEEVKAAELEEAEVNPPVVTDPVLAMRNRVESANRFENNVMEQARIMREQKEELEEGPGFWLETGRATWGAAVDISSELFISAKDLSRAVLPIDKIIGGVRNKLDGGTFGEGVAAVDEGNKAFNEDLRRNADELAPANESFAGSMGRGLLTFVAPYARLAKAVNGVKAVDAAGIGLLVDLNLFNPNEGNLSNLIGELAPETKDTVLTFLATDPDDSEALNRLRNGLEGMALGTVLEGVFVMARKVGGLKKVEDARTEADAKPPETGSLAKVKARADADAEIALRVEADSKAQVEAAQAEARGIPETDASGRITAKSVGSQTDFEVKSQTQLVDSMRTELEARKANGEAFKTAEKKLGVEERRLAKMEAQAKAEADAAPKVEAEPEARVDDVEADVTPTEQRTAFLKDRLKMDGETRVRLNEAIARGADDDAIEILSDFNIDTIDFKNIEDAQEIKHILNTVSEILADQIDDIKGGVQTHARTQRLARMVGATGEEVQLLFKDVRGDRGIAARMLAAEQTMLASAKKLFELRNIAKADPSNVAKQSDFMRQLELHSLIQAEVKGSKSEIARALNGMKIIKTDADADFLQFNEVLNALGGKAKGATDFTKFMDEMLEGGGDLGALNNRLRRGRMDRFKDVIAEFLVNSMLSSLKTHMINFTSNVFNTLLYTGDRALAGIGRRVLLGDQAAWREAKIDMVSKVSGLDEAFRLARQAWRDGAPVSDKRQRIEYQTRRAISANGTSYWTPIANRYRMMQGNTENVVETSGTVLAKTINTLGEAIRIPGRALITGDEFFKAVNRTAEINVLSFRKADEEATKQGLKYGTDAYEKFVSKRAKQLADPKSNMNDAVHIRAGAVEKSRLATFQESAKTKPGAAMERAINSVPMFKLVIAPFFRTPMNILRQGVSDRTILGVIRKDIQAVLKNGTPRERAEIITRMTTGTAAMAATYALMDTEKLEIVGRIPYGSSKKLDNIRDYSIRFGDKWYQYNRLDPLGMWMGLIADFKALTDDPTLEPGEEAGATELLQAGLFAFMNNTVNKTWAKSFSDLLEMMTSMSEGDPDAFDKGFSKFASGEFGKFIPQLVKSGAKPLIEGGEQYAREAFTFVEMLQKQNPWYNKELPIRHDVLGRPISWANRKTLIFNPFTISDAPTKLELELSALSFDIKPMRRAFAGGEVKLTATEYSEMTGLVGTIKMSRDGTLEDSLASLIERPDWGQYSDPMKVMLVKQYISEARKAARGMFLGSNPQIIQRIIDAEITVAQALVGMD